MSNNRIVWQNKKAKDLKEFLMGVDDDYVVEVLEDYYINPTSFRRIDKNKDINKSRNINKKQYFIIGGSYEYKINRQRIH